MKKRITALLASVLCLVSAVGSVSAESEPYTVTLSFENSIAEGVTKLSEDVLLIDSAVLKDGDLRIPTGVYVIDEGESVYAISAYWNSNSDYISVDGLKNPATDGNPFTYGIMTEDGAYTTNSEYKTVIADNGRGLSCYLQSAFPEPLQLLGERSDSYSFAEFDTVISRYTPEGVYSLDFSSKESPDPTTGSKCTASYVKEGSITPYTAELEYRNLTIIVGEDAILGDVNFDGSVTPTDSAQVLSIYADKASGSTVVVTAMQLLSGDINGDDSLTATDAAEILGYYAYSSTTESPLSFREYLNTNAG